MSTDALATAMAIAEAEGLTLVPADNESGFKNVNRVEKAVTRPFRVRVRHEGKDVVLGTFDTAAEAALCYARFLGPELCWQQAKRPRTKRGEGFGEGFGVGNHELLQKAASSASSVVECRIVGDGDDDERTGTVSSEICTIEGVVEACEGSPSSSNGSGGVATPRPPFAAQATPTPRWKRLRASRTEEFEVQLSAGDETIVLPVPRGAVGGRVRVSIEFTVE